MGQLLGPLKLTVGRIQDHQSNLTLELDQTIELAVEWQWWSKEEGPC